ncbi:MAG: hypothetical protein ACQ9ET_04105 [Nitrosomonadaceae bacterium]
MKELIYSTIVVMFSACCVFAANLPQRTLDAYPKALSTNIITCDNYLEKPDGVLVNRLPRLAYGLLALESETNNGHISPETVARATKLLEITLQNQVLNSDSSRYGYFEWIVGKSTSDDVYIHNSNEFALESFGPILLEYSQFFDDDFIQKMKVQCRIGLDYMMQRPIQLHWTNIYLIQTANHILLGQALGDEYVLNRGIDMLEQWLVYTRLGGMCEYDSPIYSVLQVGPLARIDRYCENPEIKQLASAGLDYFYTDYAANYFAGDGSLSGPAARCYNTLYNNGAVYWLYYINGISDLYSDDTGGSILLLDQTYQVRSEVKEIANMPVKYVQQRCGLNLDADRINYITKDFYIGSASEDVMPHDKLFTIGFGGEKRLPQIVLQEDTWDRPYGYYGVPKEKKWRPGDFERVSPSPVQDKDTVLFLIDVDAATARWESASDSHWGPMMTTTLIVPLSADAIGVLSDGEFSSVNIPEEIYEKQLKYGDWVVFKEGNSLAALYLFKSYDTNGKETPWILKYDGDVVKDPIKKMPSKVGRLVTYHYKKKPETLKDNMLTGFAATVKSTDQFKTTQEFCDYLTSIEIDVDFDGREYAASFNDGKRNLRTSRDVISNETIERTINGQPYKSRVFAVNGKDVVLADYNVLVNKMISVEDVRYEFAGDDLLIEAEQFSKSILPSKKIKDPTASQGVYIGSSRVVPDKPRNISLGRCGYYINCKESRTAYLWARVRSVNRGGGKPRWIGTSEGIGLFKQADNPDRALYDSFSVAVKSGEIIGGQAINWNVGHQGDGKWHWIPFCGYNGSEPTELKFDKGLNTLQVVASVDGVDIDRIYLSLSPDMPSKLIKGTK